MIKIYYCENCHQFVDFEGVFDIIKTPSRLKGLCKVCKNNTKIFEVEHTNLVKIGTPLGISVGIIIGVTIGALLFIGHIGSLNISHILLYSLFSLLATVLISFGIAGSLSMFEPGAAARKILREYPELVVNRQKAIENRKKEGNCIRCNKNLGGKEGKCPYCGQYQDIDYTPLL